jgi:hypothetical protein
MLLAANPVLAGQEGSDSSNSIHLRDRGTGVSTSMFGTYVRRHELIAYPFYEYYRDKDFEYKPEEFGSVGDVDFRGRYRAHEALFFIGYGLSDNVAVEFETAVIKASFNKSPADTSGLPPQIDESGFGDVEGQIRWRWRTETERRPEWFSYAELVVPHAKDKPLIGTPGVELKFGTGLTRGFGWGTLTARAAVDYSRGSSSPWDLGEYAVEYLKRLSPAWRVYAGPRRSAGRSVAHHGGPMAHSPARVRAIQQRSGTHIEGHRLGAGIGCRVHLRDFAMSDFMDGRARFWAGVAVLATRGGSWWTRPPGYYGLVPALSLSCRREPVRMPSRPWFPSWQAYS